MSAFTSIESATEPVVGESRAMSKATAHHTMLVTLEGTVTSCTAYMEGSHDGTRWTRIGTYQAPTSGMVTTQPNAAVMTYVRARLQTLVGTDPVFSASIASADDL